MSVSALEFIVKARDEASATFDHVSRSMEKQTGGLNRWKAAATIASAAVVAAVGKMAIDSVKAYSDAEDQQVKLENAYKKFPALASVSIDAMRKLNDAVQAKTGFDNDAIAAAQASLAQYGLTGKQIQQLTPLMADYAAKTGKDLPTAATDLGKAMLGQGRALKNVGLNFKDTKSAAGNFAELMGGLQGKVGGVAEAMGTTASGKLKIMNQQFEDMQETIGQTLMPVLQVLIDVGGKVTAWLSKNPAVVQALAIALGILVAAIIAVNVVMWILAANPIVLLIMAIVVGVGLLIVAIVLLVTHWNQVVAFITQIWNGFVHWIMGVINGFVGWWNGIWSRVGAWIRNIWNGFVNWIKGIWNGFVNWLVGVIARLQFAWNRTWQLIGKVISDIWNNGIVAPIRNAWNWVQNAVKTGLKVISNVWSNVWASLGGIVRGVWNGIVGWVEGGINNVIGLINGMIRAVNSVGGAIGVHIGTIPNIHIPRLASGTVTNGPMLAMIGDNPGGREVVQPVSTYQDELRRAYTAGQNSSSGPVRIHSDSLDELAAKIIAGIQMGSEQAVRSAFGG